MNLFDSHLEEKTLRCFVMAFLVGCLPLHARAQQPVHLDNNAVLLENFENDTKHNYPHKWYDRDGNKKLVNHSESFLQDYLYKVKNRGRNNFLRFEGKAAKHISLPLVNEDKDNIYGIDIYETPILSWKVRAHKLPMNASEDDDDRNDSVASIYVAFDMGRVALFKKVPKTIRYTWSSTLEKGTELSKFFGNQKIVVIESGPEKKGEWMTFQRNIVEDYKRLFGDPPPKTPLAILILSDGDSTGSWVKADYDDIMLKPERSSK
ncbi:DUF3047 domain-containing protein [Fodinibius salsisoli]|uniref:DUF3047 domain-containing protein n=1 Tax=Fodinibius salsisoli TaxID=2820877 RepID=A0ABT3PN24_9BACT|nr:DUF3047 domain-containing protein [Fodinibius salsisoli]MCW9707359.1 DUF3047 domain-containing protein [Fodinibius salsisoli]